jgi:hypothetical protein
MLAYFLVENQRDTLSLLRLVVLVNPSLDNALGLLEIDLEIIALSFVVHYAEPQFARLLDREQYLRHHG